VLLLPMLVWFLLFLYKPMEGLQIAFKDFRPLLGVEGSPWIGFAHFETFFRSFYFAELIVNTCFTVEQGDVVTIITDDQHAHLARVVAEVASEKGAWPVVMNNETR
jgi:ABC-type polysaccharide transport system permease subunit